MSATAPIRNWLVASLVAAAAFLAGCEPEAETSQAQLPYALEYPAVGYAARVPEGRAGQVAARVESGSVELSHRGPRGHLDSILQALEIDLSSQVLVFSRTSLQVGLIRPETPRAIYFNDDSYVAWVPGAGTLEVASYDPELGPVFYTVSQDSGADAVMEREFGRCLRCHDTYSLTGGGVPRFLLGSGYTGTDGELVSHEAWILTSPATPLRSRWGGWYVTGGHGDQVHLGNVVVERAEDLQDLEALRVGNVTDLSGLFDTSAYLTPLSDIVALMVLEHQVAVQNLISRLRFEAVEFEAAGVEAAGAGSADASAALGQHVEALVRAMLMVDAIGLTAPIVGSSGFGGQFESLGPFDSAGRSLRQLDLETRLFRYPLSYLIYSDAFRALPDFAREAVYARLAEVLGAGPEDDGFTRLTAADRKAVAEILAETLPEFAAI